MCDMLFVVNAAMGAPFGALPFVRGLLRKLLRSQSTSLRF